MVNALLGDFNIHHMPMKIYILLSGLLILAACKKENTSPTTTPGTCVQTSGLHDGDIIPGQYIVILKQQDQAAKAHTTGEVAEEGMSILASNDIPASSISKSFDGDMPGLIMTLSAEQAQQLKTDTHIQAIEPDRVISLSTCFTVAEPRLITWNIKRTGYGDGTGKTAWIIDTGIDFSHPDLNTDQARSRSFLPGVSSAVDSNGHGTHVAGIIAAKNNSFGVLGVASGATVVSVRVLDANGSGNLSSIIQALSYIGTVARAGDVVNMSIGEDQVSDILDQAVQNTASKGIYIAIAAGNDSQPARNFSPGRANGQNIFTVSAIDSLDNFASFSNYGNDVVDYAAPGVRILSTYMGGRYAYMSGTSMAAPHMAGLLLLNGRNIVTSGAALNDPDGSADPIAHH
jgi:subtilisin